MIKNKNNSVEPVDFKTALGERYLAYALSTIMSRSLPDVRDGLKPVTRRLLYAMSQLRLSPKTMPKKSARIVGDVIGKYHPHGDVAIYDALVRMAQDFTLRYPLVEGQGNFGNVDGDNAAAMRYTEARLTAVAEAMMEGLDEDAIDFRPTYDGGDQEPVVMPSAFPNLLANGSVGIAVGMATSIPPHNVGELCDALIHLIEKPDAENIDLMAFVKGPDFPTGGVLIDGPQTIHAAYATGRGSFRVRCRYAIENKKGGGYEIIVTEIPYFIQKSKLIEKIADLMHQKKILFLQDIRDESTEDIRLVLVPKSRNVAPEIIMSSLFKLTDLESRISLNLNVVNHKNVPMVMSLKQALQAFLTHQMEVLIRRTTHQLEKVQRRLHILEGYMIVYLNLDEVIRIIRFEDDPKALLKEKYGLDDVQVDAILNIRLRALQKLEELELRKEHDALTQESQALQDLLSSEGKRWRAVRKRVADIKKRFGQETELGRRRTSLEEAANTVDIPLEALIEKEPVTIVCSENGWMRAIKGHTIDEAAIKYKEGDKGRFALPAETTDRLNIFTSHGKFYTLGAHTLPGGRGYGEPLSLLVDLAPDEKVISMALLPQDLKQKYLVVATDGRGFLVEAQNTVAQTKNGKQVLNVPKEGGGAFASLPVVGDYVAVVGQNRRLLILPVEDIPEMNRGRGVILQKYRAGTIADLKVFQSDEGMNWENGGRTYAFKEWEKWIGKRGMAGRFVPVGFPKSNRFSTK